MGDYTPTTWVAGVTPLSAANLNNLETQHEEAVEDIGRILLPVITRWVVPGWYSNIVGPDTAITANRIYYTPIYVSEDTSFIRIGVDCGVGDGAGGTVDLRIFDMGSGIPTDLVLSAGTVSTNAAGLKEIVIAQTLTRGWYFLAARGNNTPSLAGLGQAAGTQIASPPPISGIAATLGAALSGVILYEDGAYADPANAVDGVLQLTYCFVYLRDV